MLFIIVRMKLLIPSRRILRYHSTREFVKEKYIKLNYIKSENNLYDGFTKYLNTTLISL